MKFGLFYELQTPKPYGAETWGPDDEYNIYQEALSQIELADKLGYDYIFIVEHHHLEEQSHSSAPEVFLAAASQRTKNIRLGHGIVLTPPPYNPPGRIAERIAALDLVSNGRVEFGSGESASVNELGAYHIDMGEKKAMWEEGLRVALRMMTEEPFTGYEGDFVSYPERNFVPKPREKPHPPLWVAGGRRATVLTGARLGMGTLGFAFETPDEADERLQTYWRLMREECHPIGQAVNPALGILSQFSCHPDEEEAIQRSGNAGGYFAYCTDYYYNPLTGPVHPHGRSNLTTEYTDTPEEERMARLLAGGDDELSKLGRDSAILSQTIESGTEPEEENARALWRSARQRQAVGTPNQLREFLRAYEDVHLDLMLFGNRKHEHIMGSIELFAKEVMPEFKQRHQTEHQPWRAKQLEGFEFPVNSTI